jgi:phage terminase large subunit-like protein
LRLMGPRPRVGIGAPTNADARDTCAEGETGLIRMFPKEFEYFNRSLGEARHIHGGFVKFMGTEKPRRWNGPQWSMLWFDELALCNQAAWDDANLGLRLGPRPYAVCTTTPKNRKWVKALAQDKTTYVPQYIEDDGTFRLPTTFDNLFLPGRRVEWLNNKFGNSRLGRQELLGHFIDDIEGAAWQRDWIQHKTDPRTWPRMVRIFVAVDPAGSRRRAAADQNALSEEDRKNQKKNADTGLAVVALGADGYFYVLELKSGQWTPQEWAAEAIRLFHRWKADRIIAEQNYGGLMVESTIRTIDFWDKKTERQLKGQFLPIELVVASTGKDIRAQPIATLYEQRKVWHVQMFAEGEDQMCAFIDADDNEGADMVDALVWGMSKLIGIADRGGVIITPGDPRMHAYVVH